MAILRLDIIDFRNLRKVEVNPNPHINLIVGPNGSGKTSVLEAIYLLGRGRSFRTARHKHMVHEGAKRLAVFAQTDDRPPHRIGVEVEGGRFKGKLDGQLLQRSSDLVKAFPLTLITPDSGKLIQSGPSLRRKFLDLGLFHVEHHYFSTWQRFIKSLNQRNHALRLGDRRQVGIWSDQFVDLALELDRVRRAYVERYQNVVREILSLLMDYDTLSISYRSGWNKETDLETALSQTLNSDVKRGFTQRGPHRGDLRLIVDGHPADEYLSGGQQKILASALILAQAALFKAVSQRGYTVLVDDIAAELDQEKRTKMLSMLSNLNHQVFITATALDGHDREQVGIHNVFHVKHGQITLNDVH